MKKKTRKKENQDALFSLGTIFVGVGVVFMITLNSALGIAFIALGLIWMINKYKNKK
ncbi:hypothetical protein KAI04_02885 [Candidatus Pacearchaeota archaeon]|nr:hypothetical protein [Candidatus Pacearchaeota archaeon]